MSRQRLILPDGFTRYVTDDTHGVGVGWLVLFVAPPYLPSPCGQ